MKQPSPGSCATLRLALALLVILALASPPLGANDLPAPGRATALRGAATPTPGAIAEAGARVPTVAALPRLDAPGLRPEVLHLALEAAQRAVRRGLVKRPGLLTVIDYSLPSTEKRLWVLDLEHGRVLFHELVSHGKGSGGNRAVRFSNVSMSLMSSLGLLTTAETYYGKNGYSLRLDGREPGFNDRARARAIVIHGADYATPRFIARIGRLGRSWGCPVLDPAVARKLIDTIKGGSVVFGYYPDPTYLTRSVFVGNAGAEVLKLASKTAP